MVVSARPTQVSERLFVRAQSALSGGVSSPVRAFGAVGGYPRFISSARGSRITDVDGNEYIDLVMSWGPLLHGHAHPAIVEAVQRAAAKGTSFGAPCEIELELAERTQKHLPSMELLRFVSSGTEATMSALRLARAHTGRDLIVKFDGCYHGHVDSLLIGAGSGALTHGDPTSAGITADAVANTRVLPYNDIETWQIFMSREGEQVAAVIVEPVAGNMGTIPPAPGFLQSLRSASKETNSLLIFDEVITGFRLGLRGAQGVFDITPDLTCVGKVIGGGLPAAAFGGRREIMELLSPLGPVYQAGTLSGNPVAMAAGCASLGLAAAMDYTELDDAAKQLAEGLAEAAHEAGVPMIINRIGPMLCPYFTSGEVMDLSSAQGSNTKTYARFFHAMLDRGVFLPPSQFETWMLSTAHTPSDISAVVAAARDSMCELA